MNISRIIKVLSRISDVLVLFALLVVLLGSAALLVTALVFAGLGAIGHL